ncbi:LysR family transcriptional regulator [Paenibacillus paeoniae]|uniref:LysR family transcriptional regulator n=1 Tax=Paenibacillus paeoniae TaxID=2292705 RepID=A0A371PKQ0_9BACL|nr:LysR family transcriptional regulator [Paenibacillus paeoniae]REK76772.1 LysR family transcriptional regulator [Paenibacillus paeoniae]
MEIRQLEYFMAVAKELHFTRASELLGVTQPTLSHQIKALENEIGMPLFDRIGRRTSLTEAGHILFKHGNQIFQSIASAKQELQELQAARFGKLSIGVLPGELNRLLSTLLLAFHQQYPDIEIRMIGRDDVVSGIIHNEIDIALTIVSVSDDRLTIVPLYEEELYLAVSDQHPLAKMVSVPLAQVKDEPFIVFPKAYQCRIQIDAAFKLIDAPLRPMIETDATESILNLVQGGAGVSILSKTLLHMWKSDRIVMVRIDNPPLRREIGLVYHKEKYIGYAAQQFIRLLRETIMDQGLAAKR